jgi:hypothetical protein
MTHPDIARLVAKTVEFAESGQATDDGHDVICSSSPTAPSCGRRAGTGRVSRLGDQQGSPMRP